ncbi:MAG: GAF domain-containing protein [Armatimonadetes bacterium]|nr:GAF domain-containing protein [Anaerolineae bacterium]
MTIDDTNRIQAAGAAEPAEPSSQEQVRQLARRTEELVELLRTQQEILRKRGMNLPSGSLDSLRTLKMRLDSLAKQLVHTGTELRTFRALAETTALITSSLDTDTVLNQVMDTVIALTGAERGYIVLKNRETGEFDQFRVARGLDRDQLAVTVDADSGKRGDFIVSRTIVNEVAHSGVPVLTDNASQDERYQQKQSIVGYALRSILAVPLSVKSEVIGVVYCDNRVLQGLFQQHEMNLLNAFSNQAAVAIENARLFEAARTQLAQVNELRDLLENTFNSIISGVITTDAQGIITTINLPAAEILGVAYAVGVGLTDALPPMPAAFYATLTQVAQDGEQRVIDTTATLPDRGERFWSIDISRLRDIHGQGGGIALVLDDLTEQKQRESQLAEVGRYLPMALVKNIRSIDELNVGGEERMITALFADVRGFTSFSEKLEPEVLMRVINRYLSVASDAVNLYEGIVEKYLGDAVTGLFNTQLNPQEDHALRAVRASMSLLYDLFALHEELPEEQRLLYGIGIHTDIAVLGNVGSRERKEFAALGDASTISKILQESARGTVVISPETYEIVKHDFECEQVELVTNKGREDLTHGYQVLRRKKGRTTTNLFIDPELADILKGME